MVVIVIRAQPKDSGEEIYSARSYSVENPARVFASSRMPETYDERGCFNESWPSSHDLVLNARLESRDYECVNGKRTLYNKTTEKIPWDVQERGFANASSKGHTSEQTITEFRLDSPLSKDSGYCDRATPCGSKKLTYYRVPETREIFIRKTHQPSSTMFLDKHRRNNDNNSIAYLSCSSQVDPEDSIATTKEEEWVTKKKIELTTTRQIETRVKRQVVLEDGKVVEDSGPMVTTNTTEDTEKQEHSQTEHRTLGDENGEENWVSVSNPTGCVKEMQEKTVKSREETEERTETENIQHLGDFSDEGYMTAVKSGSDDFRQALEVANKKELVESGPKIIHQSLKTKKLIDTEDKTERSQIQPGGKIVNETRTTRLHEEYGDCNVSDDDSSNSASLYETSKKENSQRYRKTKEQDITEYLANGQKIGEKLHHQAETTEGERRGDFFDFDEMDSLPSKLKRMRLRSQNSRLALENSSEQRDILSKKSSSYDQEEETRKAETSKWLEYHFGSESTKSSKGSVEDLDDIVPSTQNSFISVTMKSQPLKKTSKTKYLSPSESESKVIPERVVKNFSSDNESYITTTGRGGYFQGISQWTSKKEEKTDSIDRPTNRQTPVCNERSYSPAQFNSQKHRTYFNSTPLSKTGIDDRSSPALEPIRRFTPISQTRSDASISPQSKMVSYEFRENQSRSPSSLQFASYDKNRPSPPLRKKQREAAGQLERSFEARTRKEVQRINGPSFEHEDSMNDAPYRSSTPKGEDAVTFSLPANKKLYQRTRFAADIPPPPQPKPAPVKQKSKFGESIKKFVGKLRSSSQDRKKKRSKSNDSRSPSPRENTYQNYNSLDNYGSLVDRGADEIDEPLSPPRKFNGNLQSRPSGKGDRSLQRYYLGEDPFSASIYGREKEYEENLDRNMKNRRIESDTDGEVDFKSRTLGRFSKSTSRLLNPEVQSQGYSYDRRGAQTLPRKFRDEKIDEKQDVSENFQEPYRPSTRPTSQWRYNKLRGNKEPLPHTSSMINVSIVNQPYTPPVATDTIKRSGISLNGPAKPARTYRSNLSRSQSFNVQQGDRSFNAYKSNPHLHRLEEAPAPLESPSIISNWSQSSKTLNDDRLKFPDTKDKRRLFMKGLYDRAPELFKTLHGDNLDEVQNFKEDRNPVNYSNSFRSTSTVNTNSSIDATSPQYYRFKRENYGKSKSPIFTETYYDDNMIKTISRSESSGNDDYSETVRIKSKSDDPLNPSETDTVKTFTKKKIPLKNGLATETIESSETKTIQKSQNLRGGFDSDRSYYNSSPSGVVIKVRNGMIRRKSFQQEVLNAAMECQIIRIRLQATRSDPQFSPKSRPAV